MTFFFLQNFLNLNSFALSKTKIESGLVLDGGFDILSDEKGNFFLLSYDKNSAKSNLIYIEPLDNSLTVNTFKFFLNGEQKDCLDYRYTTANCVGDYIYLTKIKGSDTIIEKYQLLKSKKFFVLTATLNLKNIKINVTNQIAVCKKDAVFILKSEEASDSVLPYSFDGILNEAGIKQENKTLHKIVTDVSKKYIYALNNTNDILRYEVGNSNYAFENLNNYENQITDLKFLTDSVFVTPDGTICVLDGSNFKINSNAKISKEMKDYPVCVTSGFDNSSVLVKTEEKVISRIRCSDGVETGKIELGEEILAVAKSGDKIIVLTKNGGEKNIYLINSEDIIKVEPPKPDGGGEDNENTQNPPEQEDDEDLITSDIHFVDNEKYIISNVEVGTTFGEFKNNLIFNGYRLVLKDSNGNIKTGNSTKISTGDTVIFIKDKVEKYSFKIIVKGDITGTGTLTSRDISSFLNYLLGKTSLDKTALEAADINDDDEANTIDLFLMYKKIQK